MLRGVIGTENFWSGIREYYRRYRDGNASTADLRRVMEEASQQDLGWFFDEWLTRQTSPSFDGGWRYDAAAKQIEIEINQTQPGEPYRMPFEVGIVADGQPQPMTRLERLEMRSKRSMFTIAADKAPAAVTFDPNTWLLMDQIRFIKRP
jgi:aminopeptidase N